MQELKGKVAYYESCIAQMQHDVCFLHRHQQGYTALNHQMIVLRDHHLHVKDQALQEKVQLKEVISK